MRLWRHLTTSGLVALAVLAAVAAGPGRAVAAVVDVSADNPDRLSAYGGVVVWSSLDISTFRWTLRVRRNGRTVTGPQAPRDEAFDADVGPGPNGRPVVVYAARHRIVQFDPATGREKTLRKAKAGRFSSPTIWNSTLAYFFQRRSLAPLTRLRFRNLKSGRETEQIPGGAGESRHGEVLGADLRQRSLLYSWSYVSNCEATEGHSDETSTFQIWGVRQGSRKRRLLHRCNDQPSNPFFAKGKPAWVRQGGDPDSPIFVSILVRGTSQTSLNTLADTAGFDGTAYYFFRLVQDTADSGHFELVRTTDLSEVVRSS